MKRLLLIASLVFNVLLLAGVIRENWHRFKSKPILKTKVVFFGDSITACADWNSLLKRSDVRNAGFPGFTTYNLLWAVGKEVLVVKPDTCYIMAGINDIRDGIPVYRTEKNYSIIIDSMVNHKIVPIVQSTLYHVNEVATNRVVDSLNNYLIGMCKGKNIKFIDLNKSLSINGHLISGLSIDGLHLNSSGYKEWIKLIN